MSCIVLKKKIVILYNINVYDDTAEAYAVYMYSLYTILFPNAFNSFACYTNHRTSPDNIKTIHASYITAYNIYIIVLLGMHMFV